MSADRATAVAARKPVETQPRDNDVEMAESWDGVGNETAKEVADGAASDSSLDANHDGNHDLFQMIHKLSTYLCSVEEEGEVLAGGFQRIPNRRVLPDYFEVIPEPIAFSTIRGKTQKKQYTSFSEFVRDVAQICHNAQVYNRPSAPIFGAAVRLREILREELQKLVNNDDITAEDAQLPNLGELPPMEDSSSRDSEEENGLDEEDEEEEDPDDDNDDDMDSDDDGIPRRQRRLGRPSVSSRRDRDGGRSEAAHKKRGRPPMVLTPMEARISSILRGLRKFKDDDGSLLVLPFEKLPDKAAVPDYYQTITSPIALDHIKKKAKRKKYHNVDQALGDVELMFENAKLYNEDDSPVYRAAVELQQQAQILAEQEKAKPDDEFRDDDGKLALADIQYNGETWRVGDWVHIRNPNDLAKPIAAQIYRTWQDRAGQKWINACWYYRPEQTVHRFSKHFFEHEVVKTGQYRDHQIGDVLDRCFVMFVTRFNKGRPRGLPRDKDVYVCESRYNEELFRFNKIKTWASCVPDEVRERDYEMDLFEVPRPVKKLPSPIKHLLREDAKETDELPKPTWGNPNAPPIVGAVHRRNLEPNESPPPDMVPTLHATPAAVEAAQDADRRASVLPNSGDALGDTSIRGTPTPFPGIAPSPSPNQYNAHMAPHYQPATPHAGVPPPHQTPVPIPHPPQHHTAPPQMPIRPMQYQHHPPGHPQNYAPNYPQSPAPSIHHQPMANPLTANYNLPPGSARTMVPNPGNTVPHPNMYNPPRPPEVYTLPDSVNEAIPPEIRRSFQNDGAGRVLFFTAPPLDRSHGGLSRHSPNFGHSVKYLAGRKEWLYEREKKRKNRDEAASQKSEGRRVRRMNDIDASLKAVTSQAAEAMNKWFQHLDQETERWKHDSGLDK